jgi:hypothetical protein
LVALGQAIERLNPPDFVAQEAVWVITDGGSAFEQADVAQLFTEAGLNPNDYSGLGDGGPGAPVNDGGSGGSTSPIRRSTASDSENLSPKEMMLREMAAGRDGS